jgi:class 3 adenylate cyclase
VKLIGDGALVEFASVVNAVRCAAAIQTEPARERNPTDLQVRIGIHFGDVIVDGDDIYGDGVNIASRLEGIAEPGGICVSERVYEEVRNKLDIGFVPLGDRQLKNMATPVTVLAW